MKDYVDNFRQFVRAIRKMQRNGVIGENGARQRIIIEAAWFKECHRREKAIWDSVV